ncbi:MAG: Rpn family recombination-promoting nuclease/putative transposase [Lachnospiraceae bacterium]|nr:Rpn family recombination-promoting nuclease/putative transposase [Lachnospiraceae bacterium]
MGDVDISVKNFIKLRSVFAQLFSEGVYHGEVKIDPNKLQELDTVNQETVKLADGQLKNLERLRDTQRITMLFDKKMAFQIIMGVEEQTGVNYYMPVRCMELDALSYSYQCRKISEEAKENHTIKKYSDGVPKGTKIIPTVTLVFYVGKEPWDGPLSIYDMLDIPEEKKAWATKTMSDYRMNLIDARHMKDEEIERFSGDLKAFLLLLRERIDKKRMKGVVAMHRETWYAVSKIKNDRRYIDFMDSMAEKEISGGVDMDAALDYLIEECREEGREKGREEGRKEGSAKVNKLGILLTAAGRSGDFLNSLEDQKLQTQLFIEFGLEDE